MKNITKLSHFNTFNIYRLCVMHEHTQNWDNFSTKALSKSKYKICLLEKTTPNNETTIDHEISYFQITKFYIFIYVVWSKKIKFSRF